MTLTFIIIYILMHYKWYNFITTIELSTFFNHKNKPVGLIDKYDRAVALEHFSSTTDRERQLFRSENPEIMKIVLMSPGVTKVHRSYIFSPAEFSRFIYFP